MLNFGSAPTPTPPPPTTHPTSHPHPPPPHPPPHPRTRDHRPDGGPRRGRVPAAVAPHKHQTQGRGSGRKTLDVAGKISVSTFLTGLTRRDSNARRKPPPGNEIRYSGACFAQTLGCIPLPFRGAGPHKSLVWFLPETAVSGFGEPRRRLTWGRLGGGSGAVEADGAFVTVPPFPGPGRLSLWGMGYFVMRGRAAGDAPRSYSREPQKSSGCCGSLVDAELRPQVSTFANGSAAAIVVFRSLRDRARRRLTDRATRVCAADRASRTGVREAVRGVGAKLRRRRDRAWNGKPEMGTSGNPAALTR